VRIRSDYHGRNNRIIQAAEKVHGNKGKDFQGGKADSAAQWI